MVTGLTSFSFSPTSLMKFVDQLFPILSPYPFSELKSLLCSWTPEMPHGCPGDLSSGQAGSPDTPCGQYFSLYTPVPHRMFPFRVKENWCGWWGFKIVSFISSSFFLCLLCLSSPFSPSTSALPFNLSSPVSSSTPDPVPHLPFSLFLSLSWA